ncbi:hypothetical protein ACLOJK_038985 [Asimina triloba]
MLRRWLMMSKLELTKHRLSRGMLRWCQTMGSGGGPQFVFIIAPGGSSREEVVVPSSFELSYISFFVGEVWDDTLDVNKATTNLHGEVAANTFSSTSEDVVATNIMVIEVTPEKANEGARAEANVDVVEVDVHDTKQEAEADDEAEETTIVAALMERGGDGGDAGGDSFSLIF